MCKNGVFPIGHPKVYVGSDCDEICPNNNLDRVEGLVKCTILPPRDLLHPVLPIRSDKKLVFSLCRLCCHSKMQTDCPHDKDSDREL